MSQPSDCQETALSHTQHGFPSNWKNASCKFGRCSLIIWQGCLNAFRNVRSSNSDVYFELLSTRFVIPLDVKIDYCFSTFFFRATSAERAMFLPLRSLCAASKQPRLWRLCSAILRRRLNRGALRPYPPRGRALSASRLRSNRPAVWYSTAWGETVGIMTLL